MRVESANTGWYFVVIFFIWLVYNLLMIEVRESALLKTSLETYRITDLNRSQVAEEVQRYYKLHLPKASLTCERIYLMVRLLVDGLFNGARVSEIFESLKRDHLCLSSLRKYIEDVEQALTEDGD